MSSAQPSTNSEKFVRLLKELFMFDQADLDFGIYRIMNAKRDEITQFLEQDLLPQVGETLAGLQSGERKAIEDELATATDAARTAGVDPDQAPRVRELKSKLDAAGGNLDTIEAEVFSDLYNFFRRYYDEGDFISQRRYKEGVYAIPYEGEEVKLYWANHDQYYIKSSENFRNYSFKLSDGRRVTFKLVEADTERDNNRAANGNERRFILCEQNPLVEENGELLIRFEYRPDAEKQKQDKLNEAARDIVFATRGFDAWTNALAIKAPMPTNPDRTVLERHLKEYTARNTFDYFIHKDLGGFLARELDFYIKNEIVHLDDIDHEQVPRVEQYLAKVKAIRRIAHKIIHLLAQIEDFQKKLWLKKKFVVETRYCITLNRIPEEFYPEIAANDAQRNEWIALYAIDQAEGDLATAGYSVPVSVDFLRERPSLLLDTRHFPASFQDRLLRALSETDDQLDGLVVHGENFQALKLIQDRLRDTVECVYIDPPYNTDASAIDYKNGYKSSSWVSLIEGRVRASRTFLAEDGVLVAAIDDEQQRELSFILSDVFDRNVLGTFCVRANPSGRPTKTGYSVSHEYLLFAGRSSKSAIGRMPPTEQQLARFSQRDDIGVFEWRNLRREGSNSDRSARRALFYPTYLRSGSIRVPQMTWNDRSEEWTIDEEPLPGEQVAWPINEAGDEKTWRWEWPTVMASLDKLSVRKDRSGRDYVYYKRRPNEEGVVSVSSWFDAKYSATEHGTAVLKSLFGRNPFSYPKSLYAVEDAIYIAGASDPHSVVLDYFAGSGTTAHAVINLNRSDGGRRKFILVEMGEYFDTVLLPRIKKVTFTPEWNDGKPARLSTADEADRGPHFIKYIRLESYEDALNNLIVERRNDQTRLLTDQPGFREDYMLRYMFDEETRRSPSLLNVQQFANPFSYKMEIGAGSVGETREVNVDLVETFNWLLGLRVKYIDTIRGVRVIEGINPGGDKVLVLWRNVAEVDNNALDEWFDKQGYNTRDQEYDLVYVNGDNNLENLRRADQTWKVRLIEEDFHRLMFDVQDV